MSETNEIPFTKTYLFDIDDDILKSLKLMYFDSLTLEPRTEKEFIARRKDDNDSKLPTLFTSPKIVKPKPRLTNNFQPKVEKEAKEEKEDDLAKYNRKRRENGLSILTEEEFDNAMDQLSISGSETESEGEMEAISETPTKDNKSLEKSSLNDNEEEESSISFMYTKSPLILFKSDLLPNDRCFGIYKSAINALDSIRFDPLKTIIEMNRHQSNLENKMSALFMIGGGHFAGAIISHKPIVTRGNKGSIEELQLQSVKFIEYKTFHRYTTRRKQGGSQSASDNSKGKAKSAGSTLRRYNEQALGQEVRELLKTWKGLLDKCDNIFIKASGATSHKLLVDDSNDLNAPIKHGDKRVKFFPFTTKRPTTNELKRAWCELTYLKIVGLPETDKDLVLRRKKQKEMLLRSKQSSGLQHNETVTEKNEDVIVTNEIIGLLKKSKAPALIAYIRKRKLDGNFKFQPIEIYNNTPTMLHYSAKHGMTHMCQVLLTNVKVDPTILNGQGKTAYEIALNNDTKYIFQVGRHNLGEEYCNWKLSKVGEPITKEKFEEIKNLASEQKKLELKKLHQSELAKVRHKQEVEIAKNFGVGRSINGTVLNVLPKRTEEESLSSLTEAQRLRVLREQRFRAIEARLKKNTEGN